MKRAFTLIELVFVIVAIGILSAVVLSRDGSNRLQEAATQVLSHIRYTQHLAMMDDKFDATNSDWFKERWQIIFSNTTNVNDISYTIYSDANTHTGNADLGEAARDPMDPNKVLSGGSASIAQNHAQVNRKLNLGATYGITALSLSGGCGGTRITFDNFGRPLHGTIHNSTSSYEATDVINSRCNIEMESSDGNVTIAIERETGYTHIL